MTKRPPHKLTTRLCLVIKLRSYNSFDKPNLVYNLKLVAKANYHKNGLLVPSMLAKERFYLTSNNYNKLDHKLGIIAFILLWLISY